MKDSEAPNAKNKKPFGIAAETELIAERVLGGV